MNKIDETLYRIRTKMQFDPSIGERMKHGKHELLVKEESKSIPNWIKNKAWLNPEGEKHHAQMEGVLRTMKMQKLKNRIRQYFREEKSDDSDSRRD